MSTFKPKTGSPVKSTGGVILNAGNTTNSENSSLTLAQTNQISKNPGVILAVSPSESGNLGTFKPFSAGVFASSNKGQVLGMMVNEKIAGIDSDVLKSPSSERFPTLAYARGNHRIDITSWDYVTGQATKGVNAGVHFAYWAPKEGQTLAVEPFPSATIPGQFCYISTGISVTMADYKSKTLS